MPRPTSAWERWAEKMRRIEKQYEDDRLMAIVRRRSRTQRAMEELAAEDERIPRPQQLETLEEWGERRNREGKEW